MSAFRIVFDGICHMHSIQSSLLIIFLFNFCFVGMSSGIDLTNGAFRIKLNDKGVGKIFYKEQPIWMEITPQPYMRRKNYSTCAIPDVVNVIETKGNGENHLVSIRGGNPSYIGYSVKITLASDEVRIRKSFFAYGNLSNLNCVALGCRYYIPKGLIFEKELKFFHRKEQTLKMQENLPRWIVYGLKKMRIPMPNAELIIDLSEDENFWNFQNLQKFRSKEKNAYLLFYENNKWNANMKDFKWEQKITIRVIKTSEVNFKKKN